MARSASGDPGGQSAFRDAAERSFESYDLWKADFVSVGKLRGVGWAICYLNPSAGRLSNHRISLHERGNVAGFLPILVMDVWEHAYLLDRTPSERGEYISAFFANIDWKTVDHRLCAVVPKLAEVLRS